MDTWLHRLFVIRRGRSHLHFPSFLRTVISRTQFSQHNSTPQTTAKDEWLHVGWSIHWQLQSSSCLSSSQVRFNSNNNFASPILHPGCYGLMVLPAEKRLNRWVHFLALLITTTGADGAKRFPRGSLDKLGTGLLGTSWFRADIWVCLVTWSRSSPQVCFLFGWCQCLSHNRH